MKKQRGVVETVIVLGLAALLGFTIFTHQSSASKKADADTSKVASTQK